MGVTPQPSLRAPCHIGRRFGTAHGEIIFGEPYAVGIVQADIKHHSGRIGGLVAKATDGNPATMRRRSFLSHQTAAAGMGDIALIASGVLALGVGYIAWFAALQRLRASLVTIGSLLVPMIGVSSSGILVGEPLGLRECSALALTLSGVVIASRW